MSLTVPSSCTALTCVNDTSLTCFGRLSDPNAALPQAITPFARILSTGVCWPAKHQTRATQFSTLLPANFLLSALRGDFLAGRPLRPDARWDFERSPPAQAPALPSSPQSATAVQVKLLRCARRRTDLAGDQAGKSDESKELPDVRAAPR